MHAGLKEGEVSWRWIGRTTAVLVWQFERFQPKGQSVRGFFRGFYFWGNFRSYSANYFHGDARMRGRN